MAVKQTNKQKTDFKVHVNSATILEAIVARGPISRRDDVRAGRAGLCSVPAGFLGSLPGSWALVCAPPRPIFPKHLLEVQSRDSWAGVHTRDGGDSDWQELR